MSVIPDWFSFEKSFHPYTTTHAIVDLMFTGYKTRLLF